MKAVIKHVLEGSIADEAGIVPGDILNRINGCEVRDILEYEFLTADLELELEIIKADGDIEIISVYNEGYEDLGIEFENPLIDRAKFCSNKCIFCFIDQLPKNMRKTLYFKDDDSRLSFLQGNYVTLTNMSDEDIDRIVKLRLSPINISVHTSNPQLRVEMLCNKRADKILEQMKTLSQGNITMNCQIVLCRDINDQEELDRTISDLVKLYPHVNSVSVVPVGLTRYREKLFALKAFDKESSVQLIQQVEKWQDRFLAKYNSRIVFIADEFYIMADKPIPSYSSYEGFPQIENGVGLIAAMKQEFNEALGQVKQQSLIEPRKLCIATGISAYSFIESLARKLNSHFSNLNISVYAIKNNFFGKNVTVAGLITGKDLIEQLKNKELGEQLLIPSVMLRSEGDVFLDDITVEEVEKALGVQVTVVETNGFDFIYTILGI